jgi:hypothetical protein
MLSSGLVEVLLEGVEEGAHLVGLAEVGESVGNGVVGSEAEKGGE